MVVAPTTETGVLLGSRIRVSRKTSSVIVEAELAAVADHDALAPHNRFFARAARHRTIDRCGAAQLPVGFAASQVGSRDGGHGFSASTALRGQPCGLEAALGCPAFERGVCVFAFLREVPTGPRWSGALTGRVFMDALRVGLAPLTDSVRGGLPGKSIKYTIQ